MARRRSNSHYGPLLPGFWPLLAALFLLFATFGYFWVLAKGTKFEHKAIVSPEAATAFGK